MALDMSTYFKNKSNQNTIKVEEPITEQKRGKSFFDIVSSPVATIADLSEEVATGAGKSIEGIADWGLGVLGTTANIFGAYNIEDALTDAVKYDFAGNHIAKIDDWAEENSWLQGNKVGETIRQVGYGIGGMLPSIAVSVATGGAGAASMGTFMAGAAGQSTEQALYEGADISDATAYGTLSGIAEGGIEYLSGKLGGFNPLTKGAAGQLFRSGAGQVVKTFAEEGMEEVASDILDPLWKKITYSGKYETPEINELLQSFTVGGLTALAMGGAGKATNMAMYGKEGEKALSKYNEILELNQEEYDLETKGKLTKELRDKYAKDRTNLVKEFNEQLDKLDAESKKTQRLNETLGDKSARDFNSGQKLANEFTKVMKDKLGEDINIEFVDSKEFNGKYDPNTKTIYLDKNAEDPYLQVLNHEFTHTLRNSGEFNSLIDSVLNTMSEQEVVAERERLVKEHGYKNDTALLNEEIAANYVSQNILTDLGKTKRIISGNKSLGRKLLDFVTDKIKMVSPNSQEYKKMKQVQTTLESILNGKEIDVESGAETVPQYSKKKVTTNDSHGVELTPEQQEYFKNSKVRDEDGNLLVVYHGTKWAGFTVFDARDTGNGNYKFGDNIVNFFTDNEDMASSYTDNSETAKPFNTFQNMTIEEVNEMLSEYGEKVGDPTLRLVKGKDLKFKKSGYDPNKLYIEYDDGYGVLSRDGYVDMTDAVNNGLSELQVAFGTDESTELYDFIEHMIGNVYEGYLNIENPFVVDANGKYWNEIEDSLGKEKVEKAKQYINSLEGKEATIENVKKLADKLNSYGINARAKTLKDGSIELLAANDYYYFDKGETFTKSKINDIVWDVEYSTMNGRTTNEIIQDVIKTKKYDGVIIKNVIDYAEQREEPKPHDIYISIKDSNQFKSTENLNPTENPDIRYARKRRNPPEGQIELELDFEGKQKTPKKPVEPSTRKVAKEMKEYNRQQNLTEQDIDKVIADTEKKVEVVIPGDKKSTIQVVKDKFNEAKEAFKSGKLATYLKTQITDASAGVVDKVKAKYKDNKELRNSKVKELRISVNEAQRATARADWYIGTVVDKIWSPIEAKGEAYVRSFETFLLHKLNIRRMRFSATALNNIAKLEKELDAKLVELADKYNKGGYKNKRSYELDVSKTKSRYETKIKSWQEEHKNADAPVFGKEISAKESEEAAKKLLKEHPEFAEYKEQVADVFEYLRKRQLEAGLISETQFELMEKAAGRDYVPTHRANKDGISKAALSGNIGVKNGLYRAKGSSEDIRSIMVQMCEQVIAVEKKTSINKLFNTVKEMIPEEFTDDKIVSKEPVGREDADSNIIPEQNQVFFYENGERVVYQVDNEVASLFQSMRNIPSQFELGVFGKASKGLVKLTRNVTTQYNPFFAARNLFRDYFDAVIYTKNKGNFSQNYVDAAKDVFGKGKWYKMYMENGGASASFYNQDQGRDMSKKGILTKISDFNETIELIPRVAEMKASYERLIAEGKTHEQAIQEAMFDAAEVTVNFGKGGTSTKWLSSNLVPYLNGAVQGSVKFYDTFIHPESFEAWKSAMVRAGLMAIPALILNEAIFGDDDDYEELADDVKANYYLFKIGDNKFIRIPRGRIEAIFGDFAQRTVRYAKGNEDAFDTYGETIKSSVSPVESFTRTVYSPLKDVSTNTAWHGGKIENRSMENKPIKERYDENTSEIAKMLSNVYPKLSPKKWHYLLDQYSGVIGDIVLPLTSKSASIETVLFKSSGYYVNSMNNNKYSNQYYDLGAELTQNSNSDKATGVDKAKLRYYNSMNTKISELKKQKAELSDDEANATQLLIVQLQRQTIDNLKAFETTLNKYEYGLSDSDTYEDFYRESLRECFGAETALINYDTRVYEKATIFNKCGINWDTFYTVYFDAKSIDSDYDADGNVVSGSKKNKVTQYVKSLNLTATQKYMVMGLLGYKNTNGEQQVRSLLRSKGYNGEELNKIMKMCGYN